MNASLRTQEERTLKPFERDLNKQIAKLNKAIRQLVLRSKEFKRLRQLLESGAVELQIYLVPLVVGMNIKELGAKKGHLIFELTPADKQFLKKAGIRF